MGNGDTIESVKFFQLIWIYYSFNFHKAAFVQNNRAESSVANFHRLVIKKKNNVVTCSGCAAHGIPQGNWRRNTQVIIDDIAVIRESVVYSAVQRIHAHTVPAVFGKFVLHILRGNLFLPYITLREDFLNRWEV